MPVGRDVHLAFPPRGCEALFFTSYRSMTSKTTLIKDEIMIKKKKQAEIEVVRAKDVHVGMEYPYLPSEWDWEIHNIPFAQLRCAKPNPTLRLVKSDGDYRVVGPA